MQHLAVRNRARLSSSTEDAPSPSYTCGSVVAEGSLRMENERQCGSGGSPVTRLDTNHFLVSIVISSYLTSSEVYRAGHNSFGVGVQGLG